MFLHAFVCLCARRAQAWVSEDKTTPLTSPKTAAYLIQLVNSQAKREYSSVQNTTHSGQPSYSCHPIRSRPQNVQVAHQVHDKHRDRDRERYRARREETPGDI